MKKRKMQIVIDKENLINVVSIALYFIGGKSEYEDAKNVTIELINQVGYTQFDDVKIVECKDCIHQEHCHETVAHTRHNDGFNEYWSETIEWCSRGERKGGGNRMTKNEMASLKKQMTKNEIISLVSIMSYTQGLCTPQNIGNVVDKLQVGIDILMDKVDDELDEQSERKKGKWLETEFLRLRECSCCNTRFGAYDVEDFKFCPNCGARMYGENDE